jgi:hypothetical protein
MALFLLGAFLVRADDITLTDGTVFKDARVISHNEKSATIAFAGGVAMVKIELVPPILLVQPVLANFPGTATHATSAPVKPEIDPKIKEATDKGAIEINGPVLLVMARGVIMDLGTFETHEVEVPHHETKTVNIMPDGLGHTPVYQSVTSTWTTTEAVTSRKDQGPIFIACDTSDFDAENPPPWSGRIWHVGTFTYTGDDQVTHTLEKYTSHPEEAYEYFTAHPDQIPAPQPVAAADAEKKQTPVTTTTSLTTPSMNP